MNRVSNTTTGPSSLEQAYHQTCYRVMLGQRQIDLRIGQPCLALGELYLAGETTAAIITAQNPRSRVLHNAENALRQRQLCDELRGEGLRFLDTLHLADQGDWLPEQGVLVLGMGLDAALRWAARFQQNAIVFIPAGGCPELHWTTAQLANPRHR